MMGSQSHTASAHDNQPYVLATLLGFSGLNYFADKLTLLTETVNSR